MCHCLVEKARHRRLAALRTMSLNRAAKASDAEYTNIFALPDRVASKPVPHYLMTRPSSATPIYHFSRRPNVPVYIN